MNIQIGKVIRDLRIAARITQEELSGHLGVSIQAISRWENGACYPDLEMVTTLAAFFDVSADRLLCIEKNDTKENEERYAQLWTSATKKADHTRALAIANDALKIMPTNYRIMLLKTQSLIVIAGIHEENGDKEQMIRYLSQSEDVLRLIISKCNKTDIRFDAIMWLIGLLQSISLLGSDRRAEMLELVNECPAVNRSKNSVLYRFFGFESQEMKNYARAYLYELFFEFFYCAYRLAATDVINKTEQIEILKGLLSMMSITIGDDTVGQFEYLVDGIYERLYTLTGKEEYQQQIGIHLQKYRELSDPYLYQSAFFNGIVFEKKNTVNNSDGSY